MLSDNYSDNIIEDFIEKFIVKYKNSVISNIYSKLEDEVYIILTLEDQDKISNYINYNDINIIKKTYREFNLLIQKIYNLLLPKFKENNINIIETNYYIESSSSEEFNEDINLNIKINDI